MPFTKERLLIVDDELAIRTSMSHVLAEIGYSVRSADDGFAALLEINQEAPNILISDLNMRGISGFELLSVVRRSYPSIKTIAMSGSFLGDDVPSGVVADAFYQKGSSLGALLRIIEAVTNMEQREPLSVSIAASLQVDWNGRETSQTIALRKPARIASGSSPRLSTGLAVASGKQIVSIAAVRFGTRR